MAKIEITDSQQVSMTMGFADKRGNPTPAPAGAPAPEWLCDNTDLLALTPAPDGLSCLVAALGPLGSGKVSVKAADSAGNPFAAGSIDVTIISGAPSVVIVTPGTPTEQP